MILRHRTAGVEKNLSAPYSYLCVVCTQIFGPVTSATTFKTTEEAISIANDTEFGLGAGVWTRDAHQAYQVPRAIEAGRVWVNCCTLQAPPESNRRELYSDIGQLRLPNPF
jgi:hypothetical protein